jgi:hypothetical protein
MDDEADDSTPMMNADVEINGLLGLFDVPAFARRGQDLEHALGRVGDRCRRERSAMLEMVRLRLRQWASAATGPDDWRAAFTAPIDALWPLAAVEAPAWAGYAAPRRRQHAIARDLVASLVRFNHRWAKFINETKIDHINKMIDDYNQYYVLEKECVVGSARLAARNFVPKARLTREGLLAEHPLLPLPELID